MLKVWFQNMNQKRKERIRNLKGIQGYSKSYSISARIGEHYCRVCNELLKINRNDKIINSESDEAEDFDFSFDESRKIGNIKFSWDVYHCAKCDLYISTKEQRRYEREKRKLLGAQKK